MGATVEAAEPTAAAAGAVTTTEDGGYYAIKGFLFQFDKTLIEALENPQTTIGFEHIQDIDYEDYVLQIKHKETQNYTPGKIRAPTERLLQLFAANTQKKFCLYCYFRDQEPHDLTLSAGELDKLLSGEARALYDSSTRKQFANNFVIRFSEDYTSQFLQTIALLKSSFFLHDDDEAVLYHSILRSKLMDLALLPKVERRVSFQILKTLLEDSQITVFRNAYSRYLAADSYAKLIKKRYFTCSAPNIENFERLVVIECPDAPNVADLIEISARIARRFSRTGKSPQPYVIFRNLSPEMLDEVKQSLFDQGIRFFDGTHFDGDYFRLKELAGKSVNDASFVLKLAPADEIDGILERVAVREAFQFFLRDPILLPVSGRHCRIQIDKLEQILSMVC